jgi:thiol:disulfide interchange protein DsbC
MLKKVSSISVVALWLAAGSGMAEEDKDAALRAALAAVTTETVEQIQPSPIAGLQEVVVGGQVIYATQDGRYALQGELVDLKTRRSLTEVRREAMRQAILKELNPDTLITYPAPQAKHTVTVVTDIDCPYCQKLHNEMSAYHQAGITVRYLAMPRTGVDTPSYAKAVSVWCAEDRAKAMTAAKTGGTVPAKTCDNPVQEHMRIAERLGIQGTPAILTDSGKLLSGYYPAQQLAQVLDKPQQ